MIDLIHLHPYLKLNVEEIQLKLFFEMTIYHSEKKVVEFMKNYFWDVWEVNKSYWQGFEVYNEEIDEKNVLVKRNEVMSAVLPELIKKCTSSKEFPRISFFSDEFWSRR